MAYILVLGRFFTPILYDLRGDVSREVERLVEGALLLRHGRGRGVDGGIATIARRWIDHTDLSDFAELFEQFGDRAVDTAVVEARRSRLHSIKASTQQNTCTSIFWSVQ